MDNAGPDRAFFFFGCCDFTEVKSRGVCTVLALEYVETVDLEYRSLPFVA